MSVHPMNWRYWLGALLVLTAISNAVRIFSPTQAPVEPAATTSAAVTPAPTASRADIGETVTVREGNGFWPCGATTAAFDELMKWAVRGDNAELKRMMGRTHSIGLSGGMSVKILDIGFGKRKVRVLTNDAGEVYLKDEKGSFLADPRIGRECWVVAEALTR